LFEENQSNWKEDFVEPYYIEELGCNGLTASDIAKSLQTEARVIRQKLIKREFIDRIKSQGFQAITVVMANDINGLGFEEVLMDVQAAKFFVGKYDSPIGDAYLAFLLKIEQRVSEYIARIKSDPILLSLSEGIRLREIQMEQEQRLKVQERKVTKLEGDTNQISEAILNSQLNQIQKKLLKDCIDARAESLGDIRYAGAIQRDLKARFGLNKTNDKWYHLAQRHYEEANNFIGRWGY